MEDASFLACRCASKAMRPYSVNRASCCRLSSWIRLATLYTWNDDMSVDKPKMQDVKPMGVSLSNKPWVSKMITDNNSPLLLETSKGSDQTVMPVVMRLRPPRHSKASFCEFTPSFALPSDKVPPFSSQSRPPFSRRYLSTSVSRKDLPVRNAPTTDTTATFLPDGTFFSTSSKHASSSTNA